jgi:hypothetical protein
MEPSLNGLPFFRNKTPNVVNVNYEADGILEVAFRDSEILSWRPGWKRGNCDTICSHVLGDKRRCECLCCCPWHREE